MPAISSGFLDYRTAVYKEPKHNASPGAPPLDEPKHS